MGLASVSGVTWEEVKNIPGFAMALIEMSVVVGFGLLDSS